MSRFRASAEVLSLSWQVYIVLLGGGRELLEVIQFVARERVVDHERGGGQLRAPT